MKDSEILIIGGGAAGLMAAYKLSAAGKTVTVLEARDRLGGRIHTLQNERRFDHAELGAEFIHGDLPVTMDLIKTAGIATQPASGEMWRYKDGKFNTDDEAMPYWADMLGKLGKLKEDCSIDEFLKVEFAGEIYAELRDEVRKFVSGYDTADPKEASAFALRSEWAHEDDNEQPRVKGGYKSLIDFLARACKSNGGQIHLNAIVADIYHEPHKIHITTTDGESYQANKLIVALPLGVLQAESGKGAVRFHPATDQHTGAFKDIGFGAIVKVLLQFDNRFWDGNDMAKLAGKDSKQMGFVLSDKPVPTWWTQHPLKSTVLTGWLGGPAAAELKDVSDEQLLAMAMQSVAAIFNKDVHTLGEQLVAHLCINWTNDPLTRGSYAYDKVGSAHARKILNEPINDTVYFAGEYLYEGPAMGTVEAALTSGADTAAKILG